MGVEERASLDARGGLINARRREHGHGGVDSSRWRRADGSLRLGNDGSLRDGGDDWCLRSSGEYWSLRSSGATLGPSGSNTVDGLDNQAMRAPRRIAGKRTPEHCPSRQELQETAPAERAERSSGRKIGEGPRGEASDATWCVAVWVGVKRTRSYGVFGNKVAGEGVGRSGAFG